MQSRRHLAIIAGSLAVLLGALDTYVVVTIMRDIMRDVGIAVNHVQQITPIITGYLLAYIAAMPLLGRASDRFGRKLLLQTSLAVFAIGSVVTALSSDLTMLVVGRVIQGTASGALLPVTFALAADLWSRHNRAVVLGAIGAAQELGSVLGPLYGIFIVWLLSRWQDVFWINVPMTAIAMVMIQFSLPARQKTDAPPERIDVFGGVLLAIALSLAVIGLYNPAPDGKQVLPNWGPPVLYCALVATFFFVAWEVLPFLLGLLGRPWDRSRLIEPAGVRFSPFLCALGASVTAGAALMVTLVDVELFGQGVLGMDQNHAAGLLLRFLIALPIGALLGGWLATKVGDRAIACLGLLIAAGGYWLIHYWRIDVLHARHDLVLLSLPTFDTDLALAGVGLGLVIGPLTSAALRAVPPSQHGIASSAVVVARMIGMLIGVAALGAWGLYRFQQILHGLPKPKNLAEIGDQITRNYQTAYTLEYAEIFKITAFVCVVGALLGLLIGSRRTHADEPEHAPTEPGRHRVTTNRPPMATIADPLGSPPSPASDEPVASLRQTPSPASDEN